jgi:YegS/Rv2252/BmrU family lipid kinase
VCPYERRQAVVILNPVAHNVPSRKRLDEADAWLREQGWTVTWRETTGPDDARAMAAQAADQRAELVIACGGDGTVNSIANGLVGSESTLGVVAAGMSNIWAREIGLGKQPLDAVQKMAFGERRLIDTGRAGNRYFVLFVGYGFDSAVIERVPNRAKDRLGAASYFLPVVREAMSWRGRPITVRIDGVTRRLDVLMAFAGNTRLYAGITRITPLAIADDGRLDVCIYSGRGRRDIAFHAMRTLLQLHRKSPKVLYRQARRVEFEWEEPIPCHVDGDLLPDCPREVVNVPLSLWVATPAGAVSPIFSRPAYAPPAELSLHQPQKG